MTSISDIQFEFVNYSGHPRDKDNNDPAHFRKVKQHVMHNYFRKQRDRVDTNRARKPREKHRHTLAKSKCKTRPPTSDMGLVSVTSLSGKKVKYGQLQRNAPFVVTTSDPCSFGMLDPFFTLPLKGDVEADKSLRWFFMEESPSAHSALPWLSHLNASWKRKYWDMALENHGLVHVMVTLGEASRAVKTGGMNSVKWLFHKGQAMKVLREGLLEENTLKSDAFLMLISTQVSLAMVEGESSKVTDANYDSANAHRQAMVKVLNKRGGLSAVQKRMALHHVVWSDLRLAAGSFTKPALPCDPRFATQTYSLAFVEEAERRTAAVFRALPLSCQTPAVKSIFGHLQYMSLTLDKQHGHDVPACDAMNPCYQALYHVYHVLHDVKQSHYRVKPAFDPVYATLLAAAMYAWTCIPGRWPEVYHSCLVHNIQVNHLHQLRKCLSPAKSASSSWNSTGAGLELLLWVSYQGVAVASQVADRKWAVVASQESDRKCTDGCLSFFLDVLSGITEEMGVEDVKGALSVFPHSTATSI